MCTRITGILEYKYIPMQCQSAYRRSHFTKWESSNIIELYSASAHPSTPTVQNVVSTSREIIKCQSSLSFLSIFILLMMSSPVASDLFLIFLETFSGQLNTKSPTLELECMNDVIHINFKAVIDDTVDLHIPPQLYELCNKYCSCHP